MCEKGKGSMLDFDIPSVLDDEIERVLNNDILIQRIKCLVKKNLFAWDIARETGVSRSAIVAICRRMDLPLRPAIEALN